MRKSILIVLIILFALLAGCILYISKNFEITLTRRGTDRDIENILGDMIISGEKIISESFLTMEGNDVKLDQFLGGGEDYLLVDIWATWCSPCVAGLLDYQKNIAYFQQNKIKVVAIAVGDSQARLKTFINKHGISFDVLRDEKQIINRDWGLQGIPRCFLLNREGTLIMSEIGYDNFTIFKQRINQAIEEDLDRLDLKATEEDPNNF